MGHFLIIGAGIGGLTAAYALLRLGHTVRVYEAAPELREIGAGVVLGANAMRALDTLGLHDAVHARGFVVDSIGLLDAHGRPLNVVDTRPFTRRLGFDNLAIHRAELQQALLAALPPDTVQLGKRLASFEQTAEQVTVRFDDGTAATGDALVAADGIRSRVRLQLLPNTQPRYAGYTCWRGIMDATGLPLVPGRTTETWGRHGRFGVVPLANGRAYWFACINSSTPRNPEFQRYTLADLQRHFGHFHAPVPQVLAHTPPGQLLWGDILDLRPLPRFHFGRVLLLGDAAHATTPNMGQGAGMAVEDAAILARCLQEFPHDWPAAFARFTKQRRPRTTRIVEQSWQLGKVAQLTNAPLVSLRDWVMRHLPRRINEQQMAFLYEGE